MITADQIAEKLRNPEWFLENMMLILPEDDEDGGFIRFTMRAEQKQYLRDRHNRNMTPKARKLGMSTLIVLDNLRECLTVKNTHAAIVDFREEDAFKKLKIARDAWFNGSKHPEPVIAETWKEIHKVLKLVTDAAGCLAWSNGSRLEASTSFMGGTPRRIHWSEAGPQSAQAPDRARKVKRGSLNAIGANGLIDIETTMEGGEGTIARDIFDLARASVGKPLTRMDWKLHFFPWYGHPSYDLPGHEPQLPETRKYIEEMARHGINLPASRWAWWEKKKAEQKEDMWTQFPTIPEECVKSVVTGQIFSGMVTVQSFGRIRPLVIEPKYPLFTFWDIGNDGLSAWLGQMPHRDICWHRFFMTTGKGAIEAVAQIQRWESELGRPIAKHFFPHDVDYRDKGYTKTYRQQMEEAGLANHKVITVPVAGDKWDAVNAVRDRLARMWFDPACEIKQKDEFGEDLPSGIGCLMNYRTQPKAASGAIRALPLHDINSHGADAMLTFGCADELGFITSTIEADERPKRRNEVAKFSFVGR